MCEWCLDTFNTGIGDREAESIETVESTVYMCRGCVFLKNVHSQYIDMLLYKSVYCIVSLSKAFTPEIWDFNI